MTFLSEFVDRLYEAPDNAQAGYRYTSVGFVLLHVTSAVQTDEAALAYIDQVNKWYPKTKVMLLEKRDAGQQAWRLIHRVEEELLGLLPLPGVGPEPEAEGTEDTHASHASEAQPATPVTVPVIVPRVTHP